MPGTIQALGFPGDLMVKNPPVSVSIVFPSICLEVMDGCHDLHFLKLSSVLTNTFIFFDIKKNPSRDFFHYIYVLGRYYLTIIANILRFCCPEWAKPGKDPFYRI